LSNQIDVKLYFQMIHMYYYIWTENLGQIFLEIPWYHCV